MLLLKRRVGESIVIGGSIRVSVVEVRGGSVRLAIDAPPDLSVYRAELLERLGEENTRAVGTHMRMSRMPPAPHFEFPHGIPGMGSHRAFMLYDLDDDYRALVARDDPLLCLLLVDPLRVDPNYPIERAFKRYPFEAEELALAAVLTRPADGSTPTVNLAAPMVFGVESRKGVQLVLDDEALPLRAPLLPESEVRAP
jgi:carbon storage regulator CsrA